jgi:hypothetical protein
MWIHLTSLRPMSVRFFHLCLGLRNFSFLQIFWPNFLAFLIPYSCYWIFTNIVESSGHWTPTWAILWLIKLKFSLPKLYTQRYLLPALRYVKYVVLSFEILIHIFNVTKIIDRSVKFSVYTISGCQTAGHYLRPILFKRYYGNISQIINL